MDGQIVIGTKIDTKSFESQIDALEDKLDTLTKEYSVAMKDADFPEEEILKYRKEIEQTTNKLIKLKKQQDDLGKTGLQNVGKSMSSIIGKVTKWGLAVFGVRSAYMFVRQAMSTLSEYDDGMAYKLEYIRWLIATAIKPVIEWIINAVFKLIGIIGGAIKAISGVNIFANSSAKAFEKMKKNAKATQKSTSAIKKDLYGWDEATRIGESGGLAGAGGGALKIDFPDIEDFSKTVDKWAEKVKRWFFGGDTFKEGVENTFKIWEDQFKQFDKKILEPYVKTPLRNFFYPIDKYVVPPIKKTISEVKELLKPINNFFDEYFVSPIKGMFNNLELALRPIINKIIDDINYVLEPLGLKIPRIEDKIKKGTVATEKTVTGAIKNIKTSADNLTNKDYKLDIKSATLSNITKGLTNTTNSLKTLTSKTWNIKTSWQAQATSGGLQGLKNLTINLPKMAKGGILNNPGRGVPVGGAIAGERGKEFYMPLQDEQMLNMVGEAIGRYVTINLTNTIKMNARQIAKETKRVSAENDFATNS